jgi:hypothetical protein
LRKLYNENCTVNISCHKFAQTNNIVVNFIDKSIGSPTTIHSSQVYTSTMKNNQAERALRVYISQIKSIKYQRPCKIVNTKDDYGCSMVVIKHLRIKKSKLVIRVARFGIGIS